MVDELPLEIRTLKQKALFYTTAFFILLGTFSMFAFLFLVPFVIEPAFTTIFMEFDENPALCETIEVQELNGAKNCTWASCREGCTKDVYKCKAIRVNYRLNLYNYTDEFNFTEYHIILKEAERYIPPPKRTDRYERSLDDTNFSYNDAPDRDDVYEENVFEQDIYEDNRLFTEQHRPFDEISELNEELQDSGNQSGYFYLGARFLPNVKGCGYPPYLNCTIWTKRYDVIGRKFPCYYSRINPSIVISDLDLWQNTLNLVYSMAIPIPSFIISVIYLSYAYFKIYNEDEETAPLDKNAEDIDVEEGGDEDDDGVNNETTGDGARGDADGDEDEEEDEIINVIIPNGGATPISTSVTAGSVGPISPLTPNSTDIKSFGHQLKVKMADEMSRDSLVDGSNSNGIMSSSNSTSNSLHGNYSKTMTTSISTPPGPTAAV
ncbi:hypothetical protein ACFFRR_011311 [Megaselia abdita]